jgi:hypothetical protein
VADRTDRAVSDTRKTVQRPELHHLLRHCGGVGNRLGPADGGIKIRNVIVNGREIMQFALIDCKCLQYKDLWKIHEMYDLLLPFRR